MNHRFPKPDRELFFFFHLSPHVFLCSCLLFLSLSFFLFLSSSSSFCLHLFLVLLNSLCVRLRLTSPRTRIGVFMLSSSVWYLCPSPLQVDKAWLPPPDLKVDMSIFQKKRRCVSCYFLRACVCACVRVYMRVACSSEGRS